MTLTGGREGDGGSCQILYGRLGLVDALGIESISSDASFSFSTITLILRFIDCCNESPNLDN